MENENWGDSGKPKLSLEAQKEHNKQHRFNRWFDIGIALSYFVIIFYVKLWQPLSVSQDVLALVTPVIFYLLGITSSRAKA